MTFYTSNSLRFVTLSQALRKRHKARSMVVTLPGGRLLRLPPLLSSAHRTRGVAANARRKDASGSSRGTAAAAVGLSVSHSCGCGFGACGVAGAGSAGSGIRGYAIKYGIIFAREGQVTRLRAGEASQPHCRQPHSTHSVRALRNSTMPLLAGQIAPG
jgi:hypothetical protein